MAGAGGFYTGGGATVIMDSPSVAYMKICHTASGPERHLRSKARDVAFMARIIAPVGETGALKAGIKVDQNRNELGQYSFGFKVYTSVHYGFYVHEGTGPSVRQTYPNVMKFAGTKSSAGRIILTDVVHHPGTPKQPFLQNALVAMVG